MAFLSIFSLKNIRDNNSLLPLFTIIFLLGNNFLCALGSGVFDRYQALVSWLLVFAIMIGIGTVSYTHLDVYKRQIIICGRKFPYLCIKTGKFLAKSKESN